MRILCGLLLFLVSGVFPVKAEIFFGGSGFAFDLPEGFTQTGTADGTAAAFVNSVIPVQLALRLFPRYTGQDVQSALEDVFSRLNASGDTSEIRWRNNPCIIASFTMRPQGSSPASGWAVSVHLPDSKPAGAVLVALAYADVLTAGNAAVQQFILSTLDSLYIDDESWYEPGPVTTIAYPRGSPLEIGLTIEGRPVATRIDGTDAEAAQFVIEREFGVLSRYDQSPLFVEAWQRYYRQIFRDSALRLKQPAQDIRAAFPQKTQEELLRTLLAWVQKMPYERNFDTSDFTSLPAALTGQGSDCDSRAMLLAVLLRFMGSNTAIFISDVYSHAVMGIELDLPGAKIPAFSTEGAVHYLVAETTASVGPGLIAQNMSATENWFPVLFPR
jgi:hypothetical protein